MFLIFCSIHYSALFVLTLSFQAGSWTESISFQCICLLNFGLVLMLTKMEISARFEMIVYFCLYEISFPNLYIYIYIYIYI